jgi:5-methylcytosine-specific restriction endonuclease McrA
MAHPNIEERRKAVAKLIKRAYTIKDLKNIAECFNCSYHAVKSDIIFINSKYKYTVFPTKKVKLQVLERDKHTCQYCGKQNSILFVDHVIPYAMGGVGYDYNLVACCGSCNIYKGKNGRVWKPNNLEVLRLLNPEWHEKIVKYITAPTS